jgi:hypothetical protein
MAVIVMMIVLVMGVLHAGGDGYLGGRLGIEHTPEQQHEQRAEQRE